MASRKEQKERARQDRLEREQELAAKAAQRKRLQLTGGVLVIAVAVVAVIVAISVSGNKKATASPTSAADVQAASRVHTLLTGLEQNGSTLGNPNAKVTITEYGDLECSVCDEFALASGTSSPAGVPGSGVENQLITTYVRSGEAKLVYKSLQTATQSASTFTLQQAAAYAAGKQNKAWDYIELFYNEQGQEDSNYVTMSYLEGLAKQVPGLNYAQWLGDLDSAALRAQVASENTEGTQLDDGSASTPTVLIKGPKNEAAFEGLTQFSKLAQAIQQSA